MDYDVLILFSGGADSLYCSESAIQSGLNAFYLMIDYGQLHKEELKYAKKYLKNINKLHHTQTVEIKSLNIKSGLTTSDKALYDNVHDMYVPSRNMMFTSIAASIAESMNIPLIWYGADLSDSENSFPDCKQDWIVKVNELLKINGSKEIVLESPTLGIRKETIIKSLKHSIGNNLNDFMYSGYGEFE